MSKKEKNSDKASDGKLRKLLKLLQETDECKVIEDAVMHGGCFLIAAWLLAALIFLSAIPIESVYPEDIVGLVYWIAFFSLLMVYVRIIYLIFSGKYKEEKETNKIPPDQSTDIKE